MVKQEMPSEASGNKGMHSEVSGNGDVLNFLELTPRERSWVEIYPNGFDVPGSLELADDFINTIIPKSKVYEPGCGPGRVLMYLIRKKQIVPTGVDINRAAIKHAKENCSSNEASKFKVADATNSKFPNSSFDDVIMTGLIGGVEPEVRDRLMIEAYRVVKPGGRVAVAEFKFNDDPEKREKYDKAFERTGERGTRIIKKGDKELIVKHFTEDELIELFTKAGFISIQTRGESIETAGLGDGIVEARRQYTVWGTKPLTQ